VPRHRPGEPGRTSLQRRSILKSWKFWLVAAPVLGYVAFDALMLVGITFGPAPLRTCALLMGPAVQPMPSERQLIRMFDDRSDWVRECAVMQIKIRGLRGPCDAVVDLLANETSTDVLVEIDNVLVRFGDPSDVPKLAQIALRPGPGASAPRYARHVLAHLTGDPALAPFYNGDLTYDPGPTMAPGSKPSDAEQRRIVRCWWAAHRHEYRETGQ
jgi:hypothetical protein